MPVRGLMLLSAMLAFGLLVPAHHLLAPSHTHATDCDPADHPQHDESRCTICLFARNLTSTPIVVVSAPAPELVESAVELPPGLPDRLDRTDAYRSRAPPLHV